MTNEELRIGLTANIKKQCENLENCAPSIEDGVNPIDIRSLPTEQKIEAFKIALSNEDLIDSLFILNIYNLIKGSNTFSEGYFASESVFFTNIVEFLDVKRAIKQELSEFVRKLCVWYLSIISSCGVTAETARKDVVSIPFIHQRILYISNFVSMSNVIQGLGEPISTDELYNVQNPFAYLSTFAKNFLVGVSFLATLDEKHKNMQTTEQ